MTTRLCATALLIALTVGCQAASVTAPAPTASVRASVGSSSPAPSTASEPPPSAVLTLTTRGDQPIIGADAGPADHPYALPAAFVEAPDGTATLFVVWFGQTDGREIVTVATSRDGETWMTGQDPIYDDLGLDFQAPGPVPSAAVVLDDGTWVLYGWGAPTDRGKFVAWRATAPTATGPWTASPEPVLGPGPAGAWDSASVAPGSVVRDETGWTMWYEGDHGGTGIRGEIGRATSADGLAWQRSGDPVLAAGACGSGTAGAVVQPQVRRTTTGRQMLFQGLPSGAAQPAVFAATSTDGQSWACAGDAPVFRASEIPGSDGLHRMHRGTLGGRDVLFVESLAGRRSEIWLVDVTAAP